MFGSLEKEIEGRASAPTAKTPDVIVATPPVTVVKLPALPVTVVPERVAKLAVVPVTEAEKLRLKWAAREAVK